MRVQPRYLLSSVLFAVSNCLIAAPVWAEKSPTNVQYIALENGPGYIITNVILKWKDGSKVRQKTFVDNIIPKKAFCVDLSKVNSGSYNAIPEGAEVWIVVDIDSGETKSCRKDTKKFYKANGQVLRFKIGGTTFNNNRCRFTDGYPAGKMISSGNSKKCG